MTATPRMSLRERADRARALYPLEEAMRRDGLELGGTSPRRRHALCPFHDDHNPSLTVDLDDDRFRCWACGAHGDVIDYVQLREQLGFGEALDHLAALFGRDLDLSAPTPPPRVKRPPEERRQLRERGGLRSTRELFGRDTFEPEYVAPNALQRAFADWVVELGRHCGLSATVRFFHHAGPLAASCSADTSAPLIAFNLEQLSDRWLTERGPEQLELIVHEFGHAVAGKALEHGPGWGRACCRVAGLLASRA